VSRTEAIIGEESRRYEFPKCTIVSIENINYELQRNVLSKRLNGRQRLRAKFFTALEDFSARTLREPHTEKQFERGTVFMASPNRGRRLK